MPFSPGKALRPGGRACRSRFPPFLKEPFLPHDKVSTTGVRGDPWLGIPAKVPPRTPLRECPAVIAETSAAAMLNTHKIFLRISSRPQARWADGLYDEALIMRAKLGDN